MKTRGAAAAPANLAGPAEPVPFDLLSAYRHSHP